MRGRGRSQLRWTDAIKTISGFQSVDEYGQESSVMEWF